MLHRLSLILLLTVLAGNGFAQQPAGGRIHGRITDQTGAVLRGVTVELRQATAVTVQTVTDDAGAYSFAALPSGTYEVSVSVINFAPVHRKIEVNANDVELNEVLLVTLSSEITITSKATFFNLADIENPAENLVGIAQSASQGAITAAQLDARPLMRTGEVLESVPGVIVTQHSGSGKANQYFLRGFNLDHGTDFAQTIAGMPVNLPTQAHGQGYSDINFMIPELVSGVQFSKGPYYADQGDFATAGASNINYATTLERPITSVEGGQEGYARALFAGSRDTGRGNLLGALELGHDDGPWTHRDDFQKLNGVLNYSRGNAANGFTLTAMGYHGRWNSTDQIPQRAVSEGLIGRFGAIDPTDGGHSYRYSVSGNWQHSSGNSTLTRITAYGIGYDLKLFSNFTYFLDDPVHGDQFEQADHRFVTGAKVSQTRLTNWWGHAVQNTFGVQVRNDDITNIGLYHTEARTQLETRSQAAIMESTAGAYVQNEISWAPWLRTMFGWRGDGSRFRVNALDPLNSGIARAAIGSPKGTVTLGPWKQTEFYVNAGEGFHSNDARGATATRDPAGNPIDRVTPLVRAKGAEAGFRTVAIPHLQSTVSVWLLSLASELVFDGDSAGSVPSRPSRRHGVEWANYYSPLKWLVFDADASWSQARFTTFDPVGQYVPEAVGSVFSAGVAVDNIRRFSGSLRWRYFGPRALIEDNSVRSRATSLMNLDGGYRLTNNLRLTGEFFNLLNAADSDVDYYYASRLPGEPAEGINDIHFHPTIPRTVRVRLVLNF
jgi:hypothetical protein